MWFEQRYHRSVKSGHYSHQLQFQNNRPCATQRVCFYFFRKILQTKQFGWQLDFHSLPRREASFQFVFGIYNCGPIDTRLQPTRGWRRSKKPLPGLTGRDQQTVSYSFQMLIYTWRCESCTNASIVHLYWISTIQLEAQNGFIAVAIGHEKKVS